MALVSGDERELLLPLFEGIHEDPLWNTFLRRMLARTRANRVMLIASLPGAAELFTRQAHSRELEPLTGSQIAAAMPFPVNALRPGRSYALEELFSIESADAFEQQRAGLAAIGIAHARILRIAPREQLNAWLLLLHHRNDFTAADSALLSGLAPHLGCALETLVRIDGLNLRAGMAEEALALLGIGQAALTREGRVIIADAIGAAALPGDAAGRIARTGPALGSACGELADQPRAARRVLRRDERSGHDLLLRPAAAQAARLLQPAAIALVREARREDPASGARILMATHGLSPREAALAEALSRGEPLVEAGAALGLTAETTRNYSKRIYAKTGTSGQADLVRLLLTGLAVLG